MNPLFIRQKIDPTISKAQFIEDVECLFRILKEAYGLYEYYGDEIFLQAKENVLIGLRGEEFDFDHSVTLLCEQLNSFIRDGHFTVGPDQSTESVPDYGYAIKYAKLHGIDVIDCKKFWYDTEDERKQLEEFAASGAKYKNKEPLIIDLRDCTGGSEIYIWDFIKGLFDVEPGFSCKFRQKYSQIFREHVRMSAPEFQMEYEGEIEEYEQDVPITETSKKIYVLINENTCSAGESTIAYLKSFSSTILVGTHSGGCHVSGNCIQIYLPHSHIPAYFGTGMCLYEKTRNIDAEGGFRGDISYDDFLGSITK